MPHGADQNHVAESLVVEERLLSCPVMRTAALLHTALKHSLAFLSGSHKFRLLVPAVQRRLFNVDMLVCCQRRACDGYVQMIRGGNKDSIDIFPREQIFVSVVGGWFGRHRRQLLRQHVLTRHVIRVGDRCQPSAFVCKKAPSNCKSAPPNADNPQSNPVVCAKNLSVGPRRYRHRRRRCSGCKKLSPVHAENTPFSA